MSDAESDFSGHSSGPADTDTISSDEDRPEYHFCVRIFQCRLCHFSLQRGDFIVVGNPSLTGFATFPFHGRVFVGRRSRDLGGYMFACGSASSCTGGRPVPAFHEECFGFKLFEVSAEFAEAARCSIKPTRTEELRRARRTRDLFATRLAVVYPDKLPLELWQQVARYLVRECATVSAQMWWEEREREHFERSMEVTLAEDVYVFYTMREGVRYVRMLQHAGGPPHPESKLLLKSGTSVTAIEIAEDGWGIRHIAFRSKKSEVDALDVTPHVQVWWRTLSSDDGVASINIMSDGIKLRDIRISGDPGTAADGILWPTVKRPETIIDLLTALPEVDYIETPTIMNSFNCNAPGTTGYSVAVHAEEAVHIHAHGPTDISVGFYDDIESFFDWKLHWMYIPIDDGEYITAIARRHIASQENYYGLMFTTNQDRHTLFSHHSQHQPLASRARFQTVLTPPLDGTRVFYGDTRSEMRGVFLAYDGAFQPPVQQPKPESLAPLGRIPRLPQIFWYRSSCNTAGLRELVLCKGSRHRDEITGMLLKYDDGRTERLGEVRFDRRFESVSLGGTRDFYLGILRHSNGKFFKGVAKVHLSPPKSQSANMAWLWVEKDSVLEWWSSLARVDMTMLYIELFCNGRAPPA